MASNSKKDDQIKRRRIIRIHPEDLQEERSAVDVSEDEQEQQSTPVSVTKTSEMDDALETITGLLRPNTLLAYRKPLADWEVHIKNI